jgi:hypothetical protein
MKVLEMILSILFDLATAFKLVARSPDRRRHDMGQFSIIIEKITSRPHLSDSTLQNLKQNFSSWCKKLSLTFSIRNADAFDSAQHFHLTLHHNEHPIARLRHCRPPSNLKSL